MRGFSKVHIFVSPHSPVLKYFWDNTRRFAGQYSEQNGAGGDPTATPSYTIENLLSISIIRDLPCRNLSLVRKVPQTMQTSGVIFCTAYHSSASSNTISSTDLPVRHSGPVSYTHLDVYKRQTVCDTPSVIITNASPT